MLENYGLIEARINSVNIGDKFGKFEILAIGRTEISYRYYAICQCSCMSEVKKVRVDSLKNGAIVSCGCFFTEVKTTHGETNNIHYSRWKNMIDRCYNNACKSYKNYGARGIKVYEPWHKIENFLNDLPDGYFEGAEIDRTDNDGDYEPSNIRWVSHQENSKNKRQTRLIEFNGEKKCLHDWAKQIGVTHSVLSDRILNWGLEAALTMPKGTRLKNRWDGHVKPECKPKKERKLYELNGEQLTMNQLSIISGIPSKLLRKRINERNWSIERAITER